MLFGRSLSRSIARHALAKGDEAAAPGAVGARPSDPVGLVDVQGNPRAGSMPVVHAGDGDAKAKTAEGPRFGIFGRRLSRWLTPERMQILGATMQQMDGQQGALNATLDRPNIAQWLLLGTDGVAALQRQQMQRLAFDREANEQTAEQKRRQELEAMIARLPDAQRMLARLDPEGYVRAMLSGQAPEWHTGTEYTHAFRVDPGGNVVLGDELPLRPRAATRSNRAQAPELPSGFVWEN